MTQVLSRMPFFPLFRLSAVALAAAAALPGGAQTLPDAGRILQEQQPSLALPAPAPRLELSAPALTQVPEGGTQVQVQRIELVGNTRLGTEQLLAQLDGYQGQSYDLAGLQGLANRLTRYYQAEGFPFARVFVPAQQLGDDSLRLQVVEGRYGRVLVEGDGRPAAAAQGYLQGLQSGEVIESAALERAALLLSDLPGVQAVPTVRPGEEVGTGDLVVRVAPGPKVEGSLAADNHGNRYTGAQRATATVQVNSPFLTGDQLSVSGQYTSNDMRFGNVAYSLPMGGSGLRAKASYGYTYYELGKEFASLDARGNARVATVGLSYPLVRSQRRNLTLGLDLQHKQLHDHYRVAQVRQEKFSNTLPVSARFDARDSLGGGGVTFGTLSWTPGTLKLDNDLGLSDQLTARSAGRFDKFNLDIARLQALPAGLSLYARGSGQWTRDNLDSSEDFGLGGPGGVRAYPVGEGYGDRGWLAQLELRYAAGVVNPFAFYDAGQVRLISRPWASGDNHRKVAGAGVGARVALQGWQAEATLAWRTSGGDPRSDTRKRTPTAWLSAQYQF